jgi:hypothetical protein
MTLKPDGQLRKLFCSKEDVSFSFYNRFCDRVRCLVALSTESVKEQIICIKFCLKVGKIAEETHSTLREVYGDDALS